MKNNYYENLNLNSNNVGAIMEKYFRTLDDILFRCCKSQSIKST